MFYVMAVARKEFMMRYTDSDVIKIVCANCDNAGLCTMSQVYDCGIAAFGLSDSLLTPYDAIAVLEKELNRQLDERRF